MPKIAKFTPYAQRKLYEELRDRYGGMMTRQQIGIETGHTNNRRWQAHFVEDLKSYGDGIRRYYRTADVAEKIVKAL